MRIRSEADLRRILPPPRESTRAKVLGALDDQAIAFLATCPFALLGTTSPDGAIEVSPKGDEPGFAHVEDVRTLLLPERAGNNLAFGLTNILANGRVGLIFLKPGTGETLRVSGRAEVFDDADLLERLGSSGKPALLAIRVHIERSYFHCARSVVRSRLWDPASWTEKQKVSFGRIIAPRIGGDAHTADEIDARVEGAYTTNLWTNEGRN
ncbi:MAG: MSMEG_1061 family FMN-dependent PPOX-type flavoprotein [Burkholderiales bacterium]